MKYVNSLIIGNGKIHGTIDDRNRLTRLYYPNIDYDQNIDEIIIGIRINGQNNTLWLHDEIFDKTQCYEKDTNIVKQTYSLKDYGIKISEFIFIPLEENKVIRKLKIDNIPEYINNIEFIYYSKILFDKQNIVSSKYIKKDNMLLQYKYKRYIATYFSHNISTCQINDSSKNISDDKILFNDYSGMSNDAAVSINFAINNDKKIELTILQIYSEGMSDIKIKSNELQIKYINSKIKDLIKIYDDKIKAGLNLIDNKTDIVKRTLLMFSIYVNKDTGACIASSEVDEAFNMCGRYGYSWIRDNMFCMNAILRMGMEEEISNYFNKFIPNTQLEDGSFEQRYFTDGNIAPSWGIQNDQIALVVIGYYNYYKYLINKGNKKQAKQLLKNNTQVINNTISYLLSNYMTETYNIWEMEKKVDVYTLEIIKYALECYKELYDITDKNIDKTISNIKCNIKEKLSKINDESYKIDIANIIPYVYYNCKVDNKIMKKIIDLIEQRLYIEGIGYKRFENDNYIGGNAWNIATLIMAMYYKNIGNTDKFNKLIILVENSASTNHFIPEQIKKDGTKWIEQLSWSHAWYLEATIMK